MGALAFLKAESVWEDRSIVAGNPAKIIGEVSDAMLSHKIEGTGLYQQLPADCRDHLEDCTPLTSVPENRPETFPEFETWQSRRKPN